MVADGVARDKSWLGEVGLAARKSSFTGGWCGTERGSETAGSSIIGDFWNLPEPRRTWGNTSGSLGWVGGWTRCPSEASKTFLSF